MRFWVSWISTLADHRPIHFPPIRILGWWCSGSDAEGGSNLCALLDADDEFEARAILSYNWPETKKLEESGDWRIWEKVADDHMPGDRFPLSEWSPLHESNQS